ncbi:hypothetical protein PoB_005112400 [Plakobranchus ocellatus]|uniref:Uncharacterized protein n=1 Tax=Plakobranchus ocellatus TaxID=259542 RepID=A0AAV4BWM7_9GAST|nr:hypothetical protein PoB_005112400 [Plakobranchus ocellatus]
MALLWLLSVSSFLICLAVAQNGQEEQQGACFQFYGNGYLKFNLRDFNNHGHAHYSMKFETSIPNGILMYSRGEHYDDEALFLRDGKLNYHLFNTSPNGIGGQFGGLFQGEVPVNIGDSIEVHVYRAFNVRDETQRREVQQTGLVYTVNGRTYTHVDNRIRTGISLSPEVYIGGYKERLVNSRTHISI